MFVEKAYDRLRARTYAARWAFDRNPLFYDFRELGGDCTNFASQCLYAGSCVMNYTETFGWYYISPSQRSAAWTGVAFFYNFLTGNDGEGPFGREVNAGGVQLGDFIQLGGRNGEYYHTLIVTGFSEDTYLVSAHCNDALDRRLDSYSYDRARYLHIDGIRFSVPDTGNCFLGVLNGTALFPGEADGTDTTAEQTTDIDDRTEAAEPTEEAENNENTLENEAQTAPPPEPGANLPEDRLDRIGRGTEQT